MTSSSNDIINMSHDVYQKVNNTYKKSFFDYLQFKGFEKNEQTARRVTCTKNANKVRSSLPLQKPPQPSVRLHEVSKTNKKNQKSSLQNSLGVRNVKQTPKIVVK